LLYSAACEIVNTSVLSYSGTRSRVGSNGRVAIYTELGLRITTHSEHGVDESEQNQDE